MDSGKWSFDKEAATWDQSPRRVKMANDVANALLAARTLTPDMDVLEFGCGTGLLSLRLQPMVRSVTGVDSSEGMLDVLRAKIADRNLTNVRAQLLHLENGDVLQGSYHLVVCSMTLHHIKEIKPLIDQFHQVTAPGGYLCIADLDPDDGQFHGENDTVFHWGFDRASLRRVFIQAGFNDIQDRTAANVLKPTPAGVERSFSVFLMTGRK